METSQAADAPAELAGGPADEKARGRGATAVALLERWSLPIAFIIAFAFFSIARPEAFLTWETAQAILDEAAPLCIVAVGLTVVLVMGDFDLSIVPAAGLAGAASISAMADNGSSTATAILIALAIGAAVGFANGAVVAYVGIPSFIGTLAIGSLAGGIELSITDTSIFEGLRGSYINIGLTEWGGISLRTLIALGTVIAFAIMLRTTVFGRQAYAIGENPVAARLAGIPVKRLKLLGFVLTGLAVGGATVLLTSTAASYYPNLGSGLLLPAYAAAFLGLAVGGDARFSVVGSYLGALLLGMVTTGLTIMHQPSWVAALVQGFVLLGAVAGVAIRRRGSLGG